jgi:hypothetical protein
MAALQQRQPMEEDEWVREEVELPFQEGGQGLRSVRTGMVEGR